MFTYWTPSVLTSMKSDYRVRYIKSRPNKTFNPNIFNIRVLVTRKKPTLVKNIYYTDLDGQAWNL